MGKTSKWIKNLLTGKKPKGGNTSNDDASFSTEIPTTPMVVPPNTPKEKKRWSFRKSSSGAKDNIPMDSRVMQSMSGFQEEEKHAVTVAATAPTDVAVMAAQRLAAVVNRRSSALQEAAATMIQSVFRSYLARKALRALKGLVKLQALVRGHLVRKQAVTTLRCMQALVNAQARTRAQRIQMTEEAQLHTQRGSIRRSFSPQNRFRQQYKMDRHMEDNVKVVEMDLGESKSSKWRRNSYSTHNHVERADEHYLPHYPAHLQQDYHHQMSPAPSVLTDMSLKTGSGHFDEHSQCTESSDPHCYSAVSKQNPLRIPCLSPQPCVNSMSQEQNLFPNYMANTESFKAKARSQSAPKQRLELFERQPSKKKASMEGRNVHRSIRMQRSSSHVDSGAQGNQFPWPIKLDRSAVSLRDSECDSTSTALTNTYCRSLAAYEVRNY